MSQFELTAGPHDLDKIKEIIERGVIIDAMTNLKSGEKFTGIEKAADLERLPRDGSFFLTEIRISTPADSAGYKNFIRGPIRGFKKITIGDRVQVGGDGVKKQNIFEGDVSDCDTFIVGDGH